MSDESDLPVYAMSQSSFPWAYERFAVAAMFEPWGNLLLDRAGLAAGMSLLDVACGTGIVARLARRRGAAPVVGVDVSAPMLEVARAIEPDGDWREGDAAALAVPEGGSFRRVVCQQGLPFFADRRVAAAEIRRVTSPDDMLVAAVCAPPTRFRHSTSCSASPSDTWARSTISGIRSPTPVRFGSCSSLRASATCAWTPYRSRADFRTEGNSRA